MQEGGEFPKEAETVHKLGSKMMMRMGDGPP